MIPTDWLVAYISPRRESAVAAELLDLGADVYLPTQLVHHTKRRPGAEQLSLVTSQTPIFPRYLFARGIDPSVLAHVRHVTGLISTAEGPLTFPDSLMPALRLHCAAIARAGTGRQRPEWQIGDWVTPNDESPLAGLLGQITALAKAGAISVDFAQQLGTVRIPAEHLIVATTTGPRPH